jgi:hypothetical protein
MRPSGVASRLSWRPAPQLPARIESLARAYRAEVRETLAPLVAIWHPALAASGGEYAKMLELSTKMTLVGHACAALAGYDFDARRRRIAILFGCSCFLADSFLDDFGPDATRAYLQRFTLLLSAGWFEIHSERERLFYVVLARLFAERDVLDPLLRQAILRLHGAQHQDVMLRLDPARLAVLPERRRRALLKRNARDRSGHAIIVLTCFLVPSLPLAMLTLIFAAGALIMFIDDHGDCFADRRDGRMTYMNQVRDPERVLHRIARAHFARLAEGLPANEGRDLLLGFLLRYYLTRLDKHRAQRRHGGTAWDVFE